MFCTFIPLVSADGNDIEYFKQTVETYEDLLLWKEAGYPDIMGGICPSLEFGWPESETTVDLTGSRGVYLRGAGWTIPENITIRNLAVSASGGAQLNICGKWINSLEAVGTGGINVINLENSTLNLAKGTEVYGSVAIHSGGLLNGNGAYVENIETYNYSGQQKSGSISGTVKTELLEFSPYMSLNVLDGSNITTEMMAGVATGNLTIKNGAKFFCAGDTSSNLVMSIDIESGGEMNYLFDHMTPQNTVTINGGGVLNTYYGITIRADYGNGEVRGSGTINLYSRIYGFRYNTGSSKEYWTNPNVEAPGAVPCLDATIVINRAECDHAGGLAYGYAPYSSRNENDPDMHISECSSCFKQIEETVELCTYELAFQGSTSKRYECACGRTKITEVFSGSCGEGITFEMEEDKLTLEGEGTVENFSEEYAAWAEKAKNVKSVEIGKSISAIGENAFSECSSLKNIVYDGSYEDWKEIDIKEGNDVLTYAQVEFGDGSCLLASSENYGKKADLIYKEEKEASEFSLQIISENNAITEENLEKIKVFVAVYDDSGKMTGLEKVVVTVEKGAKRAECKGEIPDEKFKLLMWGADCDPMAANVCGD